MKQYKHHNLYTVRTVLLLLSVVAAVMVGGRLWNSAQKAVLPTASAHERWQTNYGKLPLSFEPNRGQTAKPVEFLARGDGYHLSLLANEAVLSLSKPAADEKTKPETATVRIKLVGANQTPQMNGQESLQGKSNYLIGPDPKQWQTDVPTYSKVKYEGVYPGVDAVFYGHQRQLEYDFIVAPGADPKAIRLEFSGAKSVKLDENGELVLATAAGDVRQHRPVIYQEVNGARQTVAGGYKLKGNQAVFELGAYDTNLPLVIDPVVSYATFFGEPNKDATKSIAVDVAGNVYLTGVTGSESFPITSTLIPYGQPIAMQAQFLFVTKINAAGTAVVYSTVINGTKGTKNSPTALESVFSFGWSIAVDAQGNASVGGYTSTTDFPTTQGAYKTSFAQGLEKFTDGFVLRLNASGNALLASTLLGGNSRTDTVTSLALDPAGNFCVAGGAGSDDFPNSDPAIGKVERGTAAFVARISADATTLIHANVLDAGGQDVAKGVAVDATGNLYVTGTTQDGIPTASTRARFPRTQGAYQYPDVVIPGNGRRIDNAFIAKFAPNGQLIYSSVLGSGRPVSISIDHDGNPCIVGFSQFFETLGLFGRPDYQKFDVFPLTDKTLVWQDSPTFGPVVGGMMLLKLNSAGTDVLVSHSFGYGSGEEANSVAVDAQGFIHVTGFTTTGFISPDGPVELEDLYQAFPYPIGSNYVFHLKFTPNGKSVAGVDFLRSGQGNAMVLDPAGNAYILGWAGKGFQLTPGALQTAQPATAQPVTTFIAKLGSGINPGVTPTPTPTPTPGPSFFNITGRVTDYAGKPMGAIPISLTGAAAASARTDGSGYFTFRNLRAEGVYRVTPLQRGPMVNFKTYYPNPGWKVFDGLQKDETANFAYTLTSPWVPPDATPTPTPTPVATPSPTPPVNQDSTLVNPRFDQGSTGWTPGGYVLFTNGVARMLPTNSLSPASVGQWVAVTPGATYVVTADVAASTTARSTLAVTFDNGGSGGGVPFNNVQQPKQMRVSFTVPAGVSQARIYVQANGSASASSWATADNFTLTRIN